LFAFVKQRFQCVIKDNLLLLHTPEEIVVSKSKLQRLTTNGQLIITMPKFGASVVTSTTKKVGTSTTKCAPQPLTSAPSNSNLQMKEVSVARGPISSHKTTSLSKDDADVDRDDLSDLPDLE